MKRPSLHRAQSNAVLRAADTTHDASPSAPALELFRNTSQSSTRTLRKSKSSPKLDQQVATAEPAPPLPASKSTHRPSGFASKFRFFKARRADSASGVIDGLPPLSTSTLAKLTASNSGLPLTETSTVHVDPLGALHSSSRLGSKLHKANNVTASVQAHARQHRANTAPSVTNVGGRNEEELVGLGIIDLCFDARTGKYRFPSGGGLFPGACDMERSRSSSGASSAEESGGPGTPTESIPPLLDSVDLGKPFARMSIDEAGCQEVIGVLGSLFLSRGDEVADPPRQSLDMSIAEGCSPILRPVDSSSSMRAIPHRRRAGSSTVNNTPVAYHPLPARSSSLRGKGFNSRNTALSATTEH